MTHRSNFAAIAVAGLIAVAPLAAIAHATETQSAQVAAQATATTEFMKTSDEIHGALNSVRAARMAIFEGNTDAASSLVADASRAFDDAGSRIGSLSVAGVTGNTRGATYVPFDTAMGLAEDFVPSPDNADALQEASEHITKGNQKLAVEALKRADIDVMVTAAMVPIDQSVTHVRDAAKLMQDGKYYEANLALKAIEESVVVEAYAIDAVPTQGSTSG